MRNFRHHCARVRRPSTAIILTLGVPDLDPNELLTVEIGAILAEKTHDS